VRDVTDLRRRDRELVTKDATIREIHHRVKNNLQTVAALLRLQARRIDVPEGRQALEEAVRRVGSIALVHETLSQAFDELVDFDDVADRLRLMATDVGSASASPSAVRDGSFGTIPAEVATPLAMVLTELLQNAAEHGYAGRSDGATGGRIVMTVRRGPDRLRVVVDDDGVGLPAGFDVRDSVSLGLSIVRTLVESELAGRLEIAPGEVRGTRVVVDVPLDPRAGMA
jgi:two-component system, sensor histidine kinase PdtaS